MQIFISWSGDRSCSLAIHLHEWLRTVVQRAETWMSDRDIEAGQRWSEELAARIKSANFGIICLTPENIKSPWVHFEAGALAEVIGSARLVPVLLGLRRAELNFPLAQFQAVEVTREGLLSLATAINRNLGDQKLDTVILSNAFSAGWPYVENIIEKLQQSASNSFDHKQKSDRQILEDLLEGVRTIGFQLGNKSFANIREEAQSWEEFYIQGVNLANRRGGAEVDKRALSAYNSAIAFAPADLPINVFSRLYAYRGAMLKRLRRLDEARQDLILARQWAQAPKELCDALYNLAGVEALRGNKAAALELIRELIEKDVSYKEVIKGRPHYFGTLYSDLKIASLVN